jgi:predicted AAA+ superfamily ATPase
MNATALYPRTIEPRIAEALQDTPVVLLVGPRQAGKTTLVRRIAEQQGLRYLSGLLTTLLDLTAGEVRQDRTRFGNVLETFVFSEMLKHAGTADDDYRLMYYRDADQIEVDVVIETGAGKLVCVEVKAAATIRESDLRGLTKLAGIAGDQFKMGVLIYNGTETMPLGKGIWAAPLSTLWGAI